MIVDDNVDLAHTGAALIEVSGYRAIVAKSPQEAIALAALHAQDQDIAAFVLDIGMPGMDGYALGTILKGTHIDATFIGHSAWLRDPQQEAEVGFSFDYFAQKPRSFDAIRELLADMVVSQTVKTQINLTTDE